MLQRQAKVGLDLLPTLVQAPLEFASRVLDIVGPFLDNTNWGQGVLDAVRELDVHGR